MITEATEIESIQGSSSSESDDQYQPPRYSLLTGALSSGSGLAAASALTGNNNNSQVSPSARYPPRYSTVFPAQVGGFDRPLHRRGQRLERDAQPDSVSGPQTHEYHIWSSGVKDKPWSTLKVYSRSSASSVSSGQNQKVPKFNGSDLVRGSLDLNIETPQTINSISLSLRGQIITSSYNDGACTFLDLPIVTWTRADGDPRTMILPEGTSLSSRRTNKKFDGKFSGKYSWPFSFPFPEAISLAGQDGQSNTVFSSPPTFLERGTNGNVQYDLVVRMSHGMLRSDSRLQVGIVYVPNIVPGSSSELCQLAYSQRQSIPSPEFDPIGWFALPSTTITGRMFKEKVKFQCTLSLSNPLCYTRGTIIPCHLSIRCKDPQALDLLSKPQCIVVRLVRCVQYYQDAGQSFLASARSPTGSDVRGAMVLDVAQVEKAVWWADIDRLETNENPHSRQVKGEIHLRKDLQSSCEFPLFKVSYAVELLAFDAPGFAISGWRTDHQTNKFDSSKAILNHPVTIATLHGEGPAPIPVTTPKPRKKRTVLRNSTEFNSGTIALGGVF